MTAVLSDYHGHTFVLPDPQEAGKRFDWQAELIMPTGTPGQAIWIGTEDDWEILRVDIDVDEGRAALRWLPDGAHAVELPPDREISVLENPGRGPATIPAGLACVSPHTARAAVVEYVATGKRPTCVVWKP